jgi:GT2 family glycosyltransferase
MLSDVGTIVPDLPGTEGTSHMHITVCIPSSRATTLGDAINSVRRQSYHNWNLIVIGQGDAQYVREATDQFAKIDRRISYIHIEQPGASRARNAGIKTATGEIVAMLDDDGEARDDWLATLVSYFESDGSIGVVSGAVVAPEHRTSPFTVCPKLDPREVTYDPVASGQRAPTGWGWMACNVAFRRSVFETVGLFDENLGPGTMFPAAEDTDYLLRLEAAGVRMHSTPRAVVLHTHGIRRGLNAVYRQQRNYARGDGACIAKLIMLSDVRGEEWVGGNILELFGLARLHTFPAFSRRLLRICHVFQGYKDCIRRFAVDAERRLLIPRSQ